MLTQQQIDQFSELARGQGYSESWIAAEIEKKKRQQEQQTQPTNVTTQQTTTPTTTTQADATKKQTQPDTTTTQPPAETNKPQLATQIPVYDQATGEKIMISPDQAPDYGLSPEDALTRLKATRDTQRISQGLPLGEEKWSQQQQEKQDVKDEIYKNAVALYDVLQKGEKGYPSKEAYDTAVQYQASRLAASRGFGEGGKTLSGSELATLAGSKPILEPPRKQNIIEKLTGKVPAETGRVLDTPEQLRQKSLSLIKDYGGAEGDTFARSQDPTLFSDSKQQPQQDNQNFSVINAAFNLTVKPIMDGTKNYIGLLAAAGGTSLLAAENSGAINLLSPEQEQKLIATLTPIIEQKYSDTKSIYLNGVLDTLGGVGAAYDIYTLGASSTFKSLGKNIVKQSLSSMAINAPLYGIGSAMEAIRNGENPDKAFVMGMTGQSNTGFFEGAFGESETAKQADTVLALSLPIIASRGNNLYARVLRGDILNGLPDVTESANSVFGNARRDFNGKAATDVIGIGNRDSVVKSEELAKNIISITENTNPTKIARELPELNAKAGSFIDSKINSLDASIGGQSKTEILNDIFAKVEQTTAAQARPDLFRRYKKLVANQLQGEFVEEPGVSGVNDLYQLRLKDINEGRKWSNKSINSNWFKNGMPLNSEADYLNMMHWIGSQTMKDMLGDSDESLRKAIEIQHVAISGEPVISNTAYNTKRAGVTGFGPLNPIASAFAHTIGSILDAGKTNIVRMQVKKSRLGRTADAIRSGINESMNIDNNSAQPQAVKVPNAPTVKGNATPLADAVDIPQENRSIKMDRPWNRPEKGTYTPLTKRKINKLQNAK